jgi:hypothetical protein
MNRAEAILSKSKALLLAMPLGVAVAVGAPGEARAQDVPPPPPAAYIATTPPEYFEGRPVYWWHEHWYYRDGPRWNFYRDGQLTLDGRRASSGHRPRYHYHR